MAKQNNKKTLEQVSDPKVRKMLQDDKDLNRVLAMYSGPIPPAAELERYEATSPGAANRIIGMAEQQSTHRIAMESIVIPAQIKKETHGQWMAFILSVLTIGAGFWLIVNDKSTEGLITIIATVGSLAGIFIYGKNKNTKELKDKN